MDGLPPFTGSISSGTQFGDKRPLRVPRLPEEMQAVHTYVQARERARGLGRAPAERRSVVLEVRSLQHGLPETEPAPDTLRIPWAFNANTFRLFEDLITRPLPDGRWVTALIAGSAALLPLTLHLLDRGVLPLGGQIRHIGTTGFRLGPHARNLVSSAFDHATVLDNYSLSELTTPALECQTCGYNHWLDPPLVFEILDPYTRIPRADGVGVLVVTTLHPFVQAMPLIRYWTGDLVERGPPCPATGDVGFRVRGRLSQSILQGPADGGALLVSPLDVEAFLDGRPEVARRPHPCDTLGLVRSPDLGVVKYELETRSSPASVTVRVELKFDPRVFPEAARELEQALGAHLLEASAALKTEVTAGTRQLWVDAVRPGQIQGTWTKF